MLEVITIGLDIAKQVFRAHGADAKGAAIAVAASKAGQMAASD